MELATRAAVSLSTGTPAASAIALASLAVGLVIWKRLPLVARVCDPTPLSPCNRRPDGPFYPTRSFWVWPLRRAARRTDSAYESGSLTADRSDWADRPLSAASLSGYRDRKTASLQAMRGCR